MKEFGFVLPERRCTAIQDYIDPASPVLNAGRLCPFLDPDISGMLSRMFPDGDCLALPAVRSVGYGKCEDDQSSD